MKNLRKKSVSMLLALLCLLSCFNAGTVFALDSTVTDHQAVVLVLDTSISMSGDPITNLKKAALEFCRKIIAADKNNQIAIVTFANNSKVNDFSNDLTKLSSTISSIYAGGGTKMANAIKSADNLLQSDKVKTGYAKNIVIMADGEPWDDTETVTTATALFPNYNMYSIGFFSSSNESAKNLLKSIQNCGYYEANNVDELIEQFNKVAEEILPLFEIDLNYESVVTNVLNSDDEPFYTITITAKVINTGSKEATNAKIKIKLPAGINLFSGESLEKELGNIGDVNSGNNAVTITWKATGKIPSADKDYQYSVVAGADNAIALEKFQTITLTPDVGYSKLLKNSDMWGFSHDAVASYNLSKKYQDFLLSNVNNANRDDIKNTITRLQNGNWEGSCYGMSRSAILLKTGLLTPSYWSKNKNTTNELSINESRDLINYYHFTQHTPEYKDAKTEFAKLNTEKRLDILKTLTKEVKNGGLPVLLEFSWHEREGWWIFKSSKYKGHAIIAYDVETANENNNDSPWVIDGKNYTTRIVTYDINTEEGIKNKYNRVIVENSYLYITDDGKDWTIPNYILSDESKKTKKIELATNDINLINSYNIEKMNYVADYAQNKYAYLRATHRRDIVNAIISNGSKYSIASGTDILGDLEIWSFYDSDSLSSSNYSINYAMEDTTSSYSYEPQNGAEDVNLSMTYLNSGFIVDSDKLVKAQFSPDKGVTAKNDGGNMELRMTLNDGYYSLPWYTIAINSTNSKQVSLTKQNDGFIVDGDNLKNITVTGNNDSETKELTFTTTEDKVLIGESKNELTVSIDKDKDGTYETVIANSGNKNNEKETAELKNLKTENFKLTPVFASSVRDYTSSVDYSVSKVSLTPTLKKGTTATISINGSKAIAFDGKQSVDLKTGENKIDIVVSGDNLVSSKYTIIVTRSKSENTKISNTKPDTKTDKDTNNKTQYTDKSPNTGNYIAKISIGIVFVITSSAIILGTYLRLKTKRKKDL